MRIVYTADTQRSQQEYFLHCVSYKHGRNEKRVQEMRYTGVEICSAGSGQEPVVGSFEDGNEHLGSTKKALGISCLVERLRISSSGRTEFNRISYTGMTA